MKNNRSAVLVLMVGAVFTTQLTTAFAQDTAFTYQGWLNASNAPATGNYDITFTLFATNTTGTLIAGPVTNAATVVSNGLFAVTLDFGDQFPGANRWLELGVRTNGAAAFTTLAPRQALTPTPYAIHAATAGAVAATNVTGTLQTAQMPAGVPVSDCLSFGYTQPNGNGWESSANTWRICGHFVFRGTAVGGTPTAAYAILYTVNPSTWYRLRLVDASNNNVIAQSIQSNTGTLVNVEAVNFGPLNNLPATQTVFQIQILATDATGTTGVLGRQSVGIHALQLF
jgi:hypothetical protein